MAAAAAEAAAAAAAEGPLHEENEWGIEVMANDGGAGGEAGGPAAGSGGSGIGAAGSSCGVLLPEGVEFSMPAAGGVDAATLRAEGVEGTEASLDELTGMLAALGGGK